MSSSLCWQCLKAAAVNTCYCGRPVCIAHSVPTVRQGDRAQGALCVDHASEQTEPVFEHPTIWMKRPSDPEPIEVEAIHGELVRHMVQGYSQCLAPAKYAKAPEEPAVST